MCNVQTRLKFIVNFTTELYHTRCACVPVDEEGLPASFWLAACSSIVHAVTMIDEFARLKAEERAARVNSKQKTQPDSEKKLEEAAR